MSETLELKQQVLSLLRDAGDDFVSGESMSGGLGVTRASVWKAVQALETDGFTIESRTRKGYRLTGWPQGLTEETLRVRLPRGDQRPLKVLEQVDSTNLEARRLAMAGAPQGTVVAALAQSCGRGRMGRSFFSPPGGLYLTMLLRPERPARDLMALTALTGVAVRRAIAAVTGLQPEIKWTNDLVCGRKKLCGIGTELSLEGESGQVQFAVVGVGINVHTAAFPAPLEDTATSLLLETGREISLADLAAEEIRQLDALCQEGLNGEKAQWMEEYAAHCMTLGKQVLLNRGGVLRRGVALRLTEDAGLWVRFDDGGEELVDSGEVSVRGLYGYVDP